MQSSLDRLGLILSFFFSILVIGIAVISARAHKSTSAKPVPALNLNLSRSSPLDLEISGDLIGAPPGSTRYLPRAALLALPQVTYTVADDANFKSPTQVSGVLLEVLAAALSAAPKTDMVIALCRDLYHANYPRSYISGHHPVLVLEINGKPPEEWPKDSEGYGLDMGPFLISHAKFDPSFRVLSHSDEPQIPWGVVRIEFRNEVKTYAAITPRGPRANSKQVQDGFRIAQQNCFRCHNNGREGGQKASRPWQVLATWAVASPEYFAAYVRNPKQKNPKSHMPGNPGYDDATLQALTAYFRTFQSQEKP